MKTFGAYIGWALAVLLFGLTLFFYQLYGRANDQTQRLVRDYEDLTAQVQALSKRNDELSQTITRMGAQFDTALSNIETLRRASGSAGQSTPPQSAAMLPGFTRLLSAITPPVPPPGTSPENGEALTDEAARMLSGLITARLSQVTGSLDVNGLVNLHYGAFLQTLDVPEDKKTAIRAALAKAIGEELTSPAETVSVRAALEDLLSPDQLTAFDQYRIERIRTATDAIVSSQLALAGPSLSKAMQERIREAIMGNMVDEAKAGGLPAAPGPDSPRFLDMYAQACAAVRPAIEAAASETDEPAVAGFFEAQARLVDTAASLFAGEEP